MAIAQESFLKVLSSIQEFRGEAEFMRRVARRFRRR
jgi:DNA-directed RNA polymerase specialized sigma24 family protein